MRKDYHHTKEVPINFKNLRHKILYRIIVFLIKHKMCSGKGQFKIGDRVRYNWMARVYIPSRDNDKIFTVSKIRDYSDGSVGIYGIGPLEGGDAFWFKKV